jgi:hypothetical protein
MPVIIVIYQAIDWQLSASMHFRQIAVPRQIGSRQAVRP